MNFSQKKINTAMILAAGLGTRLRPFTDSTPKALITANNKALIDYNIEHILKVGIKKIIINTHYLADQIQKHFQKNNDCEILLSHEEQLLNSGGGILNAMQHITNEPLLIMNSDIFLEQLNEKPVLGELIEKWDLENMDALLLLKDHKNLDYSYSGDFNLDKSGKIIRSSVIPNKLINIGAYILSPSCFKGYKVQPFSIVDILFKSNDKNFNKYRYYGLEYEGKWLDIGTIDRLNILENYLKSKLKT